MVAPVATSLGPRRGPDSARLKARLRWRRRTQFLLGLYRLWRIGSQNAVGKCPEEQFRFGIWAGLSLALAPQGIVGFWIGNGRFSPTSLGIICLTLKSGAAR